MVGERIMDAANREPIWRQVSDNISPTFSDIRNRPGEVIQSNVPQFGQRNIGDGIAVGFVGAVIMRVLKQYFPIGTEVEIANTEDVPGGTEYTVNVDAPFINTAQAQAFFESASGFSSILTDLIQVENATVERQRILKDTYQVTVFVEQ